MTNPYENTPLQGWAAALQESDRAVTATLQAVRDAEERQWSTVEAPAISINRGLLVALHSLGEGRLRHVYGGMCPDGLEGHETRDPECPACQVLISVTRELGLGGE